MIYPVGFSIVSNIRRLSDGFVPKKSALQGAISQILDSTWERINLALLNNAKVTIQLNK